MTGSSVRSICAADPKVARIERWLVVAVADRVGVAADEIDPGVPSSRYGLESHDAVEIVVALEQWLARPMPDNLFESFPTLTHLARRLAGSVDLDPGQVARCLPNPTRGNRFEARMRALNEQVREMEARGEYYYRRVVEEVRGAWATVGGRRMLMAASYGYLGLMGHPKINSAAEEATRAFGTGSHGSPLLAGTTPWHGELERALADFKEADDAIVYSSGFVANLATISALVGKGDVIIADRTNHASIAAGCRQSGARIFNYRHNDMQDLEECLVESGDATKLVVADAVFSMSGTVLDLPEVSRLCKAYGAILMVDEAHSLGVLGRSGRGIEEHFGIPGVIDVKMGTLSKTIPSAGGYIAGKRDLIRALRHNAEGFIFSGALPPPQAAAARAAIEVIIAEPERVEKLREISVYFRQRLAAEGFEVVGEETPIVPILFKEPTTCHAMTRECHEAGVFVLPVVYPAVPMKAPRLRTTVTFDHSRDEVDFLVGVLASAASKHR